MHEPEIQAGMKTAAGNVASVASEQSAAVPRVSFTLRTSTLVPWIVHKTATFSAVATGKEFKGSRFEVQTWV